MSGLTRRLAGAALGAISFCFLGLAVFAIAGGEASAHSAVVKAACKTDYYKFCPSYKMDTPQLKACMRSAGGNLSPRCIDALANAGEIPRKYHSSNLRQ
jgi:hypothetical protein